MVSMTSPRTLRAFPMTRVISALPVNHRVGSSLENLIFKISSRVNDRRCLWGKLLSSMIRYHLNVTLVTTNLYMYTCYVFYLISTLDVQFVHCAFESIRDVRVQILI